MYIQNHVRVSVWGGGGWGEIYMLHSCPYTRELSGGSFACSVHLHVCPCAKRLLVCTFKHVNYIVLVVGACTLACKVRVLFVVVSK